MDLNLGLVPAFLTKLVGAPPLAFATQDAVILALLVGLGVGLGMAVGPSARRLVRRRRGAAGQAQDEALRDPIRRSRAGLGEDPIVMALGVRDDEAARARRRRRTIGAGLHTPPGESPPPT